MIIYDEDNQPWFTAAGDPADGIARALGRRGFRRIVLPAQTIRTGVVPEPDMGTLEALAAVIVDEVKEPKPWPVSQLFIRRAVMEECCTVARSLVESVEGKAEADGTEGASEEETD